MASPRVKRIAGVLLAIAAAGVLWWLLAPTQIGGWTNYAVIRGPSMEPTLNEGDFVVARSRSRYEVGDVVLFDSETLDAHVMHRIVGIDGDGFVTQGDNKPAVDPETPSAADVKGELWLRIPGAGALIDWLRKPLHLAVVLAVLAFLALGGGRTVSRRRSGGRKPLPPITSEPASAGQRAGAVSATLLTAGLAGTVLFALLAVVAWSSAERAKQRLPDAYAQTGAFTYAASPARSPVYPTGRIDTGQAVFVNLEDRVRFDFTYRFATTLPSEVRGTSELEAQISDREGWVRRLPLSTATQFTGSRTSVGGVLDLARVSKLTEQLRQLTGTTTTTFTVDIVPRIHVTGYVGDSVLNDEFAPALPFKLDEVALRLDVDEQTVSPLAPREEGEAIRTVDASLGTGPLELSVADARTIAVTGLVASLVVAGVASLFLARRFSFGTSERIAVRFGSRLVETASPIPAGRWVTDVEDADSLVRIADLYERVILHSVENGRHQYVVDDGVAVYRYVVDEPVAREHLVPAPGG